MSRWPKISETFILNEILELQHREVAVSLYPLLRERQTVTHPEAEMLTSEANFLPFLSPALVVSMVFFLLRSPRQLLRTIWDVLTWTFGSLNFFVGALGILPKSIHMARLMQQQRISHVHCHFATHPAVAGMIVHRLTDIPFSFTAHGSDLHVDRRMLGRKVAEAAFVTTVSEYNRDIILAESSPEHHDKVHIVRCGVDLSQFRPTRPPTGTSPMRVLCVGTLHEVKGQHHLVDACARVRELGESVECRLVGDGPDRRSLEQHIRRLGLEDQICLVGALPRARVVEEMDVADVLVAPSAATSGGKREGIPVVLMEGMAMERPVVASRLSGIPELVEDCVSGILVEPGDVGGLATALMELSADAPRRERLGKAGRETVRASFELRANTEKLLTLIRSTVIADPMSPDHIERQKFD